MSDGNIIEPILTEINATTYTAVKVPKEEDLNGKGRFFSISCYTATGITFYVSNIESPSADKPVLDDTKYNNGAVLAALDGTILWAKSSAGTINLVTHIGRPGRD
jgi:hypothetical protein